MIRNILICALATIIVGCQSPEEPNEKNDSTQINNPVNEGGDNAGGDNTGGDNTGGDNTGGDNTGGENTGGENTGGENTGGDNIGGDNNESAVEKIYRDKNRLLPKVNLYRNDFIHDQTFYIPAEVAENDHVGTINLITTDEDDSLEFQILTPSVPFSIIKTSSANQYDQGRKLTSAGQEAMLYTKETTKVDISVSGTVASAKSEYDLSIQAKLTGTEITDTATFTVNVVNADKTYFIDSIDGNDSADGTTPSTAWKTMTKVNSASLVAGDAVFFKRGATWDNPLKVPTSGSETQPILFAAYGEGDKPKFDIKEKAIGAINLNRQSHLTFHDLEITGNARMGIYGTLKKNSEDAPSKNLEFNYLYVHEIDPKDEIERRPISHGISLAHTPENVKILNSEFFYFNMEAIYLSSKNAEIAYNDISYTDLLKQGGDNIQLNNVAYNYHVHHNVLDHSNTEFGKGALVCSHRLKTAGDYDAKGIFEYNVIYAGPKDGFGFTSESRSDVVRYNVIQYDHTRNASQYALKRLNVENYKDALPRFGIKGAITAYYNIVEGYGSALEVATNDTHSYFNNLFLRNEGTKLAFVQGGKTPTLKFVNNIVVGSSDLMRNSRSLSEGVTLDATYNLYTERGNEDLGVGEFIADPQFISLEHGDFKLRDTSKALSAGINLDGYGLTIEKDFAGSQVSNKPNLGIFEN